MDRTEMLNDAGYVETCRQSAWAEQPWSVVEGHWGEGERPFRFPEGWPDGVDAPRYVRESLGIGGNASAGRRTFLHEMFKECNL